MVVTLKQTTHASYEVTLTASTTQTQGQQPLTADINVVITVSNNNDVVTLPLAASGNFQRIVNLGLNPLQIFPASGDDLGDGVDGSITIQPNEVLSLLAISDTVWQSLSLTRDVSCKVTKSSNQTISNSTSTTITWDQEDYDTDSMHDNVTNNSRITIKTAGKYSAMAQFEWASNSTGKRIIDIMKNSVVLGKANYLASGNSQHTVSFVGDFDLDDILEVRVFQDSGGSLDFLTNITYFEVHKIN